MWSKNRNGSPLVGWGSSGSIIVVLALTIVCSFGVTVGQYFDPDVDDKVYLDNLQKRIETEVNTTREELYTQAKIIEIMTKQFVAAQLKENLFIALRVLAEKELRTLREEQELAALAAAYNTTEKAVQSKRQSRQDDDDDDSVGSGTTLRAADRAQFQMGLIPQVANLIKAIFGGNQNVNLTNYVSSATRLLPKPVGNQVVGLVSAISTPFPNPGSQGNPQTQGQGGLQNQGFGGATPPPLVVVVPQNSQGGIQLQGATFALPQGNTNSNANSNSNSQSFQNQFNSFQLSNGNKGSSAGSQEQQRVTTPPKTYIYNPSSAKGVGGISLTARPVTQQQNQQYQIGQQQQNQRYQVGQPQQQNQQYQIGQQQQQNQQYQVGQQQQQVQQQQWQQQQQQPRPSFQQAFQQSQIGGRPDQRPDEDEDEDEDEDGRKLERQFSLGTLLPNIIGNLGNVLRPSNNNNNNNNNVRAPVPAPVSAPVQTATAAPVFPPKSSSTVAQSGTGAVVSATNVNGTSAVTTAGGMAVEPMMAQGFNLRMFAADVGKSVNDIIKVMPDLFRGAREGVQLLQTLSQVLGGLDALGDIGGGLGGIL